MSDKKPKPQGRVNRGRVSSGSYIPSVKPPKKEKYSDSEKKQ